MKKPILLLSFALGCSWLPRASFTQITDAAAPSNPTTILVDDDKVECPTAAFTSIQAAVNAANPGDRIRVCAGSYPEQVTVNKSLDIRGDNGAIVIPSNVTVSTTSSSGNTLAAIIFVTGANGVTIRNLIIDGSKNGITECAPLLAGIFYQNSSGTIAHNALKHIRLAPSLPGCQSGDAILVENTGSTSKVEITDNSVWDYQKNGITANDAGTDATISRNATTGIGPTTGAAQNGIQIGFGASGSITNNSVADNIFSPCASPDNCPTNATGILIFQSDSVSVHNNTVGTNQIGIFIGGDNSSVRGNTVFNSEALIGVALVGNSDEAEANKITHSDQAGVFIQGNNNEVRNNEITDAPVGILKMSGSTGTTISGNTFFDTPVTVQDPAPAHALSVQPSR